MVDPIITPTIAQILSSIVNSEGFKQFTSSMISGAGRQFGKEVVKMGFSSEQKKSSGRFANSAYQKALSEYFAKDLKHREAQLQAQREFSEKLLQYLWESHRQTNDIELQRIQNDWDKDNWFSKLDRGETERILRQNEHRLLILASPPDISRDCPSGFENNLDKEIRNGLGRILADNYSLFSVNPVQFYGDYFKQSMRDIIDVERLHSILKGLPTVVLYSDMTDYQINFKLVIWGSETENVWPYRFPEWNWEKSYKELQKKRKSESEAVREIRKTIVDVYTLLSIFISDWYYLVINPLYEPQFERLTADMSSEELRVYIEYLNVLYKQNQQEIAQQRELLKPQQIVVHPPRPNTSDIDKKWQEWEQRMEYIRQMDKRVAEED